MTIQTTINTYYIFIFAIYIRMYYVCITCSNPDFCTQATKYVSPHLHGAHPNAPFLIVSTRNICIDFEFTFYISVTANPHPHSPNQTKRPTPTKVVSELKNLNFSTAKQTSQPKKMSQAPQPNAPPPYDDAQKYPTMYPDANTQQGVGYQPSMTNPYPPPTQAGLQQPPPPPQQQSSTTTYVYVSEEQPQFGPRPQNAFCPNCRQHVLTKIKYNAGLLTWLLFGGCLLFGCWMGCCLIPFCVDDCQDCEHYCSNCKAFLGQYKRL